MNEPAPTSSASKNILSSYYSYFLFYFEGETTNETAPANNV